MDRSPLSSMFNPASVAVFGASERAASVGARVFQNMKRAGFAGDLYPVNPKHQKVGGMRCYPDLAAIGKPVDLAVIATPAPGAAPKLTTPVVVSTDQPEG